MNILQELEVRRNSILEEMRSIRSMEKGTITEQYFQTVSPGEKKAVRQGPYYVFSRREGDKTVSRRLRSPAALEQARQDVAAYKKFLTLCQEFVQLTEKLGALAKRDPERQLEKKRHKSPWSKMEK